MPANDIKLLRYRRHSETQRLVNIRRSISESGLLNDREPEDDRRPGISMLKLSKTRISVGDSVTVYWDIREQCGANDWIGLFHLGRCTLSAFVRSISLHYIRTVSKCLYILKHEL